MHYLYLFTIISCMFCCTSLQATVRESVYIGAGCGAAFDHFDFTARNTNTGFTIKRKTDKTQYQGTAFVGYGYTFPGCFYLAGEIGTNFPRHSGTIHRPGVTLTDFRFENHVSVQEYVYGDVLPGYRVSQDFLIYARVGGSYGKLKLKLDQNIAAGVAEYNFHSTKWGFRAGVGINYTVNEYIGLGLDYIYTEYPKFKTHIDLYASDQIQQPQTHYVGVSVILNFPDCNCW